MALFNVIVKGGFWETNGVGSFQGTTTQSSWRSRVAHALGQKGLLDLREIWFVLTGAAPGATATKNYTAIAPSVELGGLRAIETQVLVNRATTSGDANTIKDDMLRLTTRTSFGATPPFNGDRNPLGTR